MKTVVLLQEVDKRSRPESNRGDVCDSTFGRRDCWMDWWRRGRRNISKPFYYSIRGNIHITTDDFNTWIIGEWAEIDNY